MIRWREGKGGFVGAAKRLIKGVFSYSFTVTSAAVTVPNKTFGILSIMQSRGVGVSSAITTSIGLSSGMDSSQGALSILQSRGLSVTSSINSSKGVDSTI